MDAKFEGEIRKVKDGTVVPADQWICFLAKDDAFAAILPTYLAKCEELGADIEQIRAVQRLIRRVRDWRRTNPDLLKVPDAAGEKMLF